MILFLLMAQVPLLVTLLLLIAVIVLGIVIWRLMKPRTLKRMNNNPPLTDCDNPEGSQVWLKSISTVPGPGTKPDYFIWNCELVPCDSSFSIKNYRADLMLSQSLPTPILPRVSDTNLGTIIGEVKISENPAQNSPGSYAFHVNIPFGAKLAGGQRYSVDVTHTYLPSSTNKRIPPHDPDEPRNP